MAPHRRRWAVLAVALLVAGAGCGDSAVPETPGTATEVTGSAAPEAMPDDFAVEYRWQEGSLPPPYFYEYTIRLAVDGGEIEFSPDYSSNTTPVWTEPVPVAAADWEGLYRLMVGHGVFTTAWREASDIPVGGSSQWMTVVAGGTTYRIPPFVDTPSGEAALGVVYAAINGLVPDETWEDLTGRQEQYQLENPE